MTGFRAYTERVFLLVASAISELRAEARRVISNVLPSCRWAWAPARRVALQPALSAHRLHTALAWSIRRRLLDARGFALALEGLAAIALSH